MSAVRVAPVMPDYAEARATFSWRRERSRLAGLPGGGVNTGYEAVDRHLREGHGERVALRCVARDGSVRTVTYTRLAQDSSRFAHVLESLGIGRGEQVFTLLGRCHELYAAVLGTLRAGRVLCPLFAAFGPEPVALRMGLGDARVLVTTRELYEHKVARARGGRLRASGTADPSLTVTNLGDQGVETVFGVVHPPQVALVGLGRIVERPVAVRGLLGVRPVLTATSSADHRAADGATGARLLTSLDRFLQRPEEL
ncbi:2-oxo acid dehydrogenase subunit E2 [Streptomyces sp. NPDC056053]|uniref:2-oxo acid dehydrogenase subunit E2 n=1 Tax=Streptomyces sp. NPDC056053 TaxID=3345696 RepID=UPI0035DAA686